MSQPVSVKAHAKINLGLDIAGRRENGYHEVRMIMQTISLSDTLTMEQTDTPGIFFECGCPELPGGEDNLAVKAVKLMKALYHIKKGVVIRLQKCIPISAGLAGGSADAAAALKGMNRLFGLSLSSRELREIGVSLGADIPYCIMEGTALAEGIGERLTPLPPLPPCFVLVAMPPIAVSTKEVYCAYDRLPSVIHPDIDGMLPAIQSGAFERVIPYLGNVLEAVTAVQYPVIETVKAFMKAGGAANALMSGSGPSIFGLFRREREMEDCTGLLKAQFPSFSVFPASFYHPAGTLDKE